MFGSKKEPKEKPKYKAWVGYGSSYDFFDVYEYRLLDTGVVEFRTPGGKIAIMPGTPCKICGGIWNNSSE